MVRAVSERDISTFAEDTETTEEEKATALKVPDLPAVIQGDGRHVMSLLKDYLAESTKQVNLANGFTQEDIDDEADGAVQTPRNFTLTFTRDGGRFTWDHIRDIASLAFYELRTDVYVGEETGLLERTVNNYSTAMPVTFVGHVYLYAFNQDGLYSNPAEILYNKPRPDAPTNISITTNADGTMVTFSEIPNNCIGAYVYIDNKRYTAYDNVFIITDDIKGVEQIKVSFFDQFGEGEQGILYLVLPDVTGLLVERNGPELDFYWDPINIYNVKYVVKVCSELSWERGTELFRTATNDKNRRLYPNRGDYYLMVKAYDEHGNYSKNAAYQFMTTETDISRNIILEFDQADTAYSGSKLNVYYDPVLSGVTLDADATYGEYIFNVELDQEYKARNWLEYNAFSVTDNNTWTWEDYTVAWQDANIHWAGVLGDVDSANIRQEIAYYKGVGTNNLFYAQLDGDLLTEDEESPEESQHADDFRQGRWAQGLYIGPLTRLSYDASKMQRTFNLIFFVKLTEELNDTRFVTLYNENNEWLSLGYDKRLKSFYLFSSDGKELWVPFSFTVSGMTYFTFGISQGSNARCLYINYLNKNQTEYAQTDAEPLGILNKLAAYPVII